MLAEDARCAKASFTPKVIGDHRLAGPGRVPGRALAIGSGSGLPDDAGPPSHPGPDDELPLLGQVLHGLAELASQPERAQSRRLLH